MGSYEEPREAVAVKWVFDNFDVEKEGLTVDRIDVDGHYEPGNLQFVTSSENGWNKRVHKE